VTAGAAGDDSENTVVRDRRRRDPAFVQTVEAARADRKRTGNNDRFVIARALNIAHAADGTPPAASDPSERTAIAREVPAPALSRIASGKSSPRAEPIQSRGGPALAMRPAARLPPPMDVYR